MQLPGSRFSDSVASFMTSQPSPEKLVVSGVPMPDVSAYRAVDSAGLQFFGRCGTTYTPRMPLARMFGNGMSFIRGASGKQFAYALRECLDVFGIQCRTTLSRPLSS